MSLGEMNLLKQKSFTPFFIVQFFGTFNDNAFKYAMLTLISYHLSTSQHQSEIYQAIASALYILPFVFLSAMAGQLADKFCKADMTGIIKVFEVVLVAIGGVALYYGYTWLLMIMLMGLGVHSTFFGPIKYAILPDLLSKKQLLGATAWIEASTFVAILLGTILGAISISGLRVGTIYAITLTGISAILGLTASFYILPSKAVVTNMKIDWHCWRATKDMIKTVLDNKKIAPTIYAISWFWVIGAVILTKLPDYTYYVLRADSTVFSIFLALFSIGIALGSMVINRCLDGKITLRFVPVCMLFLSVFTIDLYWISSDNLSGLPLQSWVAFFKEALHWRIALDLFLLSFCCGLFIVPLYTYLQISTKCFERARTIAANNIFNSIFMVFGSLVMMLLLQLKVGITAVFLLLGLVNIIVASLFFIFQDHRRYLKAWAYFSQFRAGKK